MDASRSWSAVDDARLDDAKREYAYGPAGGLRDRHVGTFSDAPMSEAKKSGWLLLV
jgi:hypothetical protein